MQLALFKAVSTGLSVQILAQWHHKISPINHFGTVGKGANFKSSWIEKKSIKFRFIENKKSGINETGLDVFNNYITTKYWSILRPLLFSFKMWVIRIIGYKIVFCYLSNSEAIDTTPENHNILVCEKVYCDQLYLWESLRMLIITLLFSTVVLILSTTFTTAVVLNDLI